MAPLNVICQRIREREKKKKVCTSVYSYAKKTPVAKPERVITTRQELYDTGAVTRDAGVHAFLKQDSRHLFYGLLRLRPQGVRVLAGGSHRLQNRQPDDGAETTVTLKVQTTTNQKGVSGQGGRGACSDYGGS